jgi:hypothetical protein
MSRRVLYLQGASVMLNPTLDKSIVDSAYDDDAESARAEWGGEFRNDVTAYLTDDVIDRSLCPGERSRQRLDDFRYVGFVDAAGGVAGGDSMTCAIAHQGERGRVFIDQLVAVDPPFDTEAAVERCAMALKSFGVANAQADRYAGLWPAQSFQRHGIGLTLCELDKSAIYREVAPLFVSHLVSLIDDARLEVELRGLERTPRRGGRGDAVDHAPGRGSHDDRINAVAGALWMASRVPFSTVQGANTIQQTRVSYDPLTRDEDRARDREQSDPRPSYARPILYLD